jgi:putative transposase
MNAALATRRQQFKKTKLRWRASRGAKRSLGWIPFKAVQLKRKGHSGLDLGLRDTVATSDGDKLEAGHFYRSIEARIANAQRRGHKRRRRIACKRRSWRKASRKTC